jgi:hypothetical protein
VSLPKRVVIHKRTPFLKDEREGLIEGLGGIESIDMLEISIELATRWVASRVSRNELCSDGFPARRGTAVVLRHHKAL